MIKRCRRCKQQFETKRNHARFCSSRCTVAAWREHRDEQERQAQAVRAQRKREQWYTPAEVAEAARAALGGRIDLDPASCDIANRTIKAVEFYSLPDKDGLVLPWYGRVFMNPPFGEIGPLFVKRLAAELAAGRVEQAVVLLATSHTQNDRFQPIRELSPIICYPPKRIRFTDEDGVSGQPKFPSVVLGVGVHPEPFAAAFQPLGRIYSELSAAA